MSSIPRLFHWLFYLLQLTSVHSIGIPRSFHLLDIQYQENPELFNTESKLKTFAENGHTSAEMLRETYINKIDTERQSLEAVVSDFQKKIDSGESIHRVVNPKFSHKEN